MQASYEGGKADRRVLELVEVERLRLGEVAEELTWIKSREWYPT